MYDLSSAAARAGIDPSSVAKLLQDTQLNSSENLGPGRGLGHRFTERDVDALRAYRELRRRLWSRHAAARAAEAFRVSEVSLGALRIVMAGDRVLVGKVGEPLPAVLYEVLTARVANIGPATRSRSESLLPPASEIAHQRCTMKRERGRDDLPSAA